MFVGCDSVKRPRAYGRRSRGGLAQVPAQVELRTGGPLPRNRVDHASLRPLPSAFFTPRVSPCWGAPASIRHRGQRPLRTVFVVEDLASGAARRLVCSPPLAEGTATSQEDSNCRCVSINTRTSWGVADRRGSAMAEQRTPRAASSTSVQFSYPEYTSDADCG